MQVGKEASGKPIMSTKRIQFEALEKGTGSPVPELHFEPMSESILYLWNTYADIKKGCEGRITFVDIQAFTSLYNCELAAFEIDIILKLEVLYWSVNNE